MLSFKNCKINTLSSKSIQSSLILTELREDKKHLFRTLDIVLSLSINGFCPWRLLRTLCNFFVPKTEKVFTMISWVVVLGRLMSRVHVRLEFQFLHLNWRKTNFNTTDKFPPIITMEAEYVILLYKVTSKSIGKNFVTKVYRNYL